MTTPPNIDDADRAPDGGEDRGDWAAWEKTFRDARPVLPDAAMQRIDQAIKLEVQRASPASAHRGRWPLIVTGCVVFIAGAIWILTGRFSNRPTPGAAPTIEERLPLTYPSAPRRVGPTTSALPLAEERQAVIVAAGKSVDQGIATYRGPVTISIGPTRIACDALTVFRESGSQSRLLSGKGKVHGENVQSVGTVSAEEFTFNTATGRIVFSGNVRVVIDGKASIVPSLTITPEGTIQTTRE